MIFTERFRHAAVKIKNYKHQIKKAPDSICFLVACTVSKSALVIAHNRLKPKLPKRKEFIHSDVQRRSIDWKTFFSGRGNAWKNFLF